jgi:hypothetical protein
MSCCVLPTRKGQPKQQYGRTSNGVKIASVEPEANAASKWIPAGLPNRATSHSSYQLKRPNMSDLITATCMSGGLTPR